MPATRISYIELPVPDVSASKQFYGAVFGWSFEDFGPEYSAFHDAGVEGGFNGAKAGAEGRSAAPLIILQTDDLEAMEERVKAGGGRITVPIFAFPGGRRFHFMDPAGNELAVLQPE